MATGSFPEGYRPSVAKRNQGSYNISFRWFHSPSLRNVRNTQQRRGCCPSSSGGSGRHRRSEFYAILPLLITLYANSGVMRGSRRRRSRKLIRFSASLLPQTATFTTHSEIRQPRLGVLPIASLASWGRQTAKREAHTGGRTQDLPMTLLRVGCSTNGALRAVITLMFLFLVQRIQSVKPSKDCYASLGFLNIVCRAIRQIAGNKRSDS